MSQFPPSAVPAANYTDDGRPILFYAKALANWFPKGKLKLDFRRGDIIAVTRAPEDGPLVGWWSGEVVGTSASGGRVVRRGYFPNQLAVELGPPRQGLQPPLTRLYTDEGWPILFYVKAVNNYIAMLDDEMDFLAGDMIAVTDASEDGWWSGELLDETRREMGRNIFPRNCVCLFGDHAT